MEITWHNNSCFTIKDRSVTLVINPDRKAGKLHGDIILSSIGGKENLGEVEGASRVFDWPGEYEVKDIPIKAYQAWTKAKSKEEETGKGDKTIIFCFEVDGMKVCHLGDLGHTLTSDMLKEIGDVDVLMVKIGKNSNLDTKKANEVIEAIEPRVIIPMSDEDPAAALKGIWSDKIETLEKFVVKDLKELPEEQTKCVVLSRP